MRSLYILLVVALPCLTAMKDSLAGSIKPRNDEVDKLSGSFYGKIIDAKTNLPLSRASVYMADIKTGDITDENGSFEIRNIPEGKHLVEISHVGYTTTTENIEINGNTRKDFTLSESVVENNAVIVTGVSSATQTKKVPF